MHTLITLTYLLTCFTVQFDDGITITAVMPEELFSIYEPNVRTLWRRGAGTCIPVPTV